MLEYSLRVLEYYRLLDILSRYAASPLGRSDCLSLKPLKEPELIKAEQRLVSEMKQLLHVKGFVSLSSLVDLRPVLKKAGKKGAHLDPKELLAIRNLLRISHQARNWVHEAKVLCPCLAEILDDIPACDDLAKEIGRSITEDGGISDDASPMLSSLRAQRVERRRAVEKGLADILEKPELHSEGIVSVRDGRYVISARTEERNLIGGIVHGYSRSHSTCFIEPMVIVEENNRLVELLEQEREEERRVLERLTGLVAVFSSELYSLLDIMGRVDGVYARAEFSKAINGISPIYRSEKSVYLLGALNPILLSLYLESGRGGNTENREEVVPIDVKIDAEKSTLIISGPNRGGKTVALKTIGLLTLMSQAGMHIPVREGSRLSVFNNILAEIGDDQDIAAGLSTFSARLEHLKEIVDHAGGNSLVILDELGTGTDPDEGTSLAMAILDYLSEQGALSAISTHYQRLKRYSLINHNAQNASVEFDYGDGKPTFKLRTGLPGVSHAIDIARDSGIKTEIIDKAATYLGKGRGKGDLLMEDVARLMEELREEKEAVSLAKREYELSRKTLEDERQRLIGQLNEIVVQKEKGAERILSEAKREFAKAIGNLKEKGSSAQCEATEKYTRTKRELMDAIAGLKEEKESVHKSSFTIGQSVFHKKSKKRGVVVGIAEGSPKARILTGNVKLSVDSSELILESEGPPQQKEDKEAGKRWSVSSLPSDKKQLSLVGCTVSEALPLVDRMIDQALVHGYTRLKIVHGVGSGTLKRAIREHLKKNFYVRGLSQGGGDGSSDGITIVEL